MVILNGVMVVKRLLIGSLVLLSGGFINGMVPAAESVAARGRQAWHALKNKATSLAKGAGTKVEGVATRQVPKGGIRRGTQFKSNKVPTPKSTAKVRASGMARSVQPTVSSRLGLRPTLGANQAGVFAREAGLLHPGKASNLVRFMSTVKNDVEEGALSTNLAKVMGRIDNKIDEALSSGDGLDKIGETLDSEVKLALSEDNLEVIDYLIESGFGEFVTSRDHVLASTSREMAEKLFAAGADSQDKELLFKVQNPQVAEVIIEKWEGENPIKETKVRLWRDIPRRENIRMSPLNRVMSLELAKVLVPKFESFINMPPFEDFNVTRIDQNVISSEVPITNSLYLNKDNPEVLALLLAHGANPNDRAIIPGELSPKVRYPFGKKIDNPELLHKMLIFKAKRAGSNLPADVRAAITTLGITPDLVSNQEAITSAFNKAVKEIHPDVNPNEEDVANRSGVQQLQEARNLLLSRI